jgi:thiol-disulfide isomerase/thioredoxin
MKYKYIFASFILILILSSCEKPVPQAENEIIFAGKILNFEKHSDFRNIDLVLWDFLEIQKTDTIAIDDNGFFRTSFTCNYPMDFFIFFQRTPATFLCSPGDSLFITIDADILNDPKNKYPNGQYFARVVGGNRIGDNIAVNDFLIKVAKVGSWIERNEAATKLNPMEYVEFQSGLEQRKTYVLDSILQTTQDELFQMWAKDYIKFYKLDELFKYPSRHSKLNKINIDSLNIPDIYYTEILNEDINANKVLSNRHNRFLQTYYVHLYKQAKKGGIGTIDYINENASGFVKDIALSKYFFRLVKNSDSLTNINLELIEDKSLREILEQRIQIEQKKKIELLQSNTNSELLDSLFGKYKGKVVYVDFWATWCGPCLEQMRYSKELQGRFKGKAVEFLYLCNQSSKENWQEKIKEDNLSGVHILLDRKQFAQLKSIFNISGIPHYLLINKQGGFINNAFRPEDKNIVKKINMLLNE